MANGANYTKMQDATPANRLLPGEYDGRVKTMQDSITLAGETTAVSLCGLLPKNAIVLAVHVSMASLGNTIDIGDALDTARYFNDQSDGAVFEQPGNVLAGINYRVLMAVAATLDNQIILTPSAAVTGEFKITVSYTHD